jgi:hypothetical protein
VTNFDAKDIAEAIRNTDQYASWFGTIKQRIKKAESYVAFRGFTSEQLAEAGEDEQSIDAAIEENNLIEILETLSNYA